MLSLVQVLALGAVTFFLLPVVVRADDHDPFANFSAPGESHTIHCEFTGQEAWLDETVFCRLRVANGSVVDGSFSIFMKEDSYEIFRCPDQGRPGIKDDIDQDTGGCANNAARVQVPESDPRFDRFLGFWAFSVTTRPVLSRDLPTQGDIRYDDRFVESCPKRSVDLYDGGPEDSDLSQMCDLGIIRGLATTRFQTDMGEPAYERQYFLGMTLRDDGTDQTEFTGWELHFDLIVRGKVPADDPCPTSRVNGVCGFPIYERR